MRRWVPQLPGTIALWAATVYFALPLVWMVTAAMKTQGELSVNPGFLVDDFALGANLDTLFSRSGSIFGRWMLNSAIYAGVGAAVATLLAVPAGYAISKFRFRGREATFSLILAGVMVPPAALALPLFLMFAKMGLTNTYASVLLPSMVAPLGVYLGRVTADTSIPDELLEAAAVDGASPTRTFFSISFPLLRPVVITVFLFQLVAIWNNFMLPLVMLNTMSKYPVTLGLYNWSGQQLQEAAVLSSVITGSVLSIIPLIAGFLLLQRFWRTGMTVGSVKG